MLSATNAAPRTSCSRAWRSRAKGKPRGADLVACGGRPGIETCPFWRVASLFGRGSCCVLAAQRMGEIFAASCTKHAMTPGRLIGNVDGMKSDDVTREQAQAIFRRIEPTAIYLT